MSPRALPLSPSLPPSLQPFSCTKHRADGLTRRSNLSLSPFSSSPRALLELLLSLVPYPSRPFTPRFATAAPYTPVPLFIPCATLHHHSCAPVVPWPHILLLLFSLTPPLSFVQCFFVFVYFALSLSLPLLALSLLPQIAPKLFSQDARRTTHPLKKYVWKK